MVGWLIIMCEANTRDKKKLCGMKTALSGERILKLPNGKDRKFYTFSDGKQRFLPKNKDIPSKKEIFLVDMNIF